VPRVRSKKVFNPAIQSRRLAAESRQPAAKFIAQRSCCAKEGLNKKKIMIPQHSKDKIRRRVHSRIRKKMTGSQERPRLNIYRSTNHIYAQVIDDEKGVTIVSAATTAGSKGEKKDDKAKAEKGKTKKKTGGNLASAKEVGKLIAQRAQEKGIKSVVFDRGGYLYHGRVKALADAAREAGLEF
jgi:large subunit ribosomal protein L18